MQEGFLFRTPRGRKVTEKAYLHLGKAIEAKQNSLFD
ncbi:MAG: hypothetical protein CSA04_00645 [Bacteroidetes bacterium]|nr:MAG: hypothetical protein CSA04_00645 [Bacteroidota bacterium]